MSAPAIGDKFTHWVVVEVIVKPPGHMVTCRCICGVERVFRMFELRTGRHQSCGCMRGAHRHTSPNKGGKSLTYSSWSNMVARCAQPSNPAFAHYKQMGVSVCDRWRKFENFLADMGERPSAEHTLDRYPNNGGNYEPGNVRWATKREQANNRATNKLFEYRGQTYTLANLARETGVSKDILRKRLIRSGLPWTVEGAVNTPKQTRREAFQYC